MKKWIILGIVVLGMAIGIQYRPRDLKKLILQSAKEEMVVRVFYTTATSSRSYINESKEYKLTVEDEEYHEILDICDKYSYHQSAFQGGSQMAYYDQSIGEVVYNGMSINDISIDTSGAYFVNFYGDIGYKKSDRIAFIMEIEEMLSNCNKDYLYRRVTFENDEIVDDYIQKYWVEE